MNAETREFIGRVAKDALFLFAPLLWRYVVKRKAKRVSLERATVEPDVVKDADLHPDFRIPH